MYNRIRASLVWLVVFAGCAMEAGEEGEIGVVTTALTTSDIEGELVSIVTSTGKCLDVPSGSGAIGVGINQYRCHSGLNQLWRFHRVYREWGHVQSWDWGYIQNENSGLCLEIRGGARGRPAYLQQNRCSQQEHQLFSYSSITLQFRVRHSDMCLDVPGGRASDGLPIQQYRCHFGSAQRFVFSREGTWSLDVEGLHIRMLNEGRDEPILHVLTHQIRVGTPANWSDADAGLYDWGSRSFDEGETAHVDDSLEFHNVQFGPIRSGMSLLAVALIGIERDRCSGWDRRTAALRGHDVIHRQLNRRFSDMDTGARNILSSYSYLGDAEDEIADEIRAQYERTLDCSFSDSDDLIDVDVMLFQANASDRGLGRTQWFSQLDEWTLNNTTLFGDDASYEPLISMRFGP